MTIEIPVLLLYIIGAIAGVVVLFFSVIFTSALVAVALEPKMVLMKLERCNGKYDNAHGEFGKVINRECIGCQRRVAQGDPIKVPEFSISCPKKVSETE